MRAGSFFDVFLFFAYVSICTNHWLGKEDKHRGEVHMTEEGISFLSLQTQTIEWRWSSQWRMISLEMSGWAKHEAFFSFSSEFLKSLRKHCAWWMDCWLVSLRSDVAEESLEINSHEPIEEKVMKIMFSSTSKFAELAMIVRMGFYSFLFFLIYVPSRSHRWKRSPKNTGPTSINCFLVTGSGKVRMNTSRW